MKSGKQHRIIVGYVSFQNVKLSWATGSDLIATVNYHSSGGQICSALHREAPSEALAELLC